MDTLLEYDFQYLILNEMKQTNILEVEMSLHLQTWLMLTQKSIYLANRSLNIVYLWNRDQW